MRPLIESHLKKSRYEKTPAIHSVATEEIMDTYTKNNAGLFEPKFG